MNRKFWTLLYAGTFVLLATTVFALNLSRVKTWGVEILTHTDLNAEFDNILDHSIANADVSATAAIVASKLDLTVASAIGSTTPSTGAFTTLYTTGDITMEGATANNFETTLTVTDPTADRTVTFQNATGTVALKAQTDQAIGSTSGPTTVSTSYVDLTDMSVTMTTGANPVLIIFSGAFSNSNAGNDTYIILDIDGTDETASERRFKATTNNYSQILTFSHLETMTAAAHTFKTQWKTEANTATADGIKRSMQVIEYK